MKRFKLADIRKELKKDIKEKFQIKKVEVSTDQKVILELDKLEEEIQDKSVNKNELKKGIKTNYQIIKKTNIMKGMNINGKGKESKKKPR